MDTGMHYVFEVLCILTSLLVVHLFTIHYGDLLTLLCESLLDALKLVCVNETSFKNTFQLVLPVLGISFLSKQRCAFEVHSTILHVHRFSFQHYAFQTERKIKGTSTRNT